MNAFSSNFGPGLDEPSDFCSTGGAVSLAPARRMSIVDVDLLIRGLSTHSGKSTHGNLRMIPGETQ